MSVQQRYPALHRPDRWEWAAITMQFSTEVPDEDLVVSTHVVGFVDDAVLLCRVDDGNWILPGGTREPGESVVDSLARELREEAGAQLIGDFHPVGAHVGQTEAKRPYRPHLSHPRQAWLWGWVDAVIIGPPANPDDGEVIVEVAALPLSEAVRRVSIDADWVGELILLAAEQRAVTLRRACTRPAGTSRAR